MSLLDDVALIVVAGTLLAGWTPLGREVVRGWIANRATVTVDETREIARMDSLHALNSHPRDLERQEEIKEILHQQTVEHETAKLESLKHNRALMNHAFEEKAAQGDYEPLKLTGESPTGPTTENATVYPHSINHLNDHGYHTGRGNAVVGLDGFCYSAITGRRLTSRTGTAFSLGRAEFDARGRCTNMDELGLTKQRSKAGSRR